MLLQQKMIVNMFSKIVLFLGDQLRHQEILVCVIQLALSNTLFTVFK